MRSVLPVVWFFLVAEAVEVSDVEYYSIPRLFELDDYDECFGSRGAFCLGSFQLSSRRYSRLMDVMKKLAKDKNNFNHTIIHRGYCVTSTCSHIEADSLPYIFEECVQNMTKTKYGLDAGLLNLEYCKTAETPPKTPIDMIDFGFALIVGVLVIGNVVGTAYDMFRNPDNKPNPYLMTWSAFVNWSRLTATYEGDPRLSALNPINGMKAITLVCVVVAHSVIAHHMVYVLNPRFLERANLHPLATILNNGTSVVQTFILLSSFLLAYNVLLSLEADPKKEVGFAFWGRMVLHRIVRITPLYMFVVGLSATWWRHASDGPLWSSLVVGESDRCRTKWWTHALYVNNLVMPDDRCLIQTWFLAVDMQLYLLTSVLLVWLVHKPSTAVKMLSGFFVLSVLVNFCIVYHWDLKTILYITYPEYIRWQYKGVPSFKWQYAAPWSSAPAAILGLLLAFAYYLMQKHNYNLQETTYFRILYRLSVPCGGLWIMSGYLVKAAESKFAVALYSTLDRPVFSVLVGTAMIGFFYKVDDLWWRFLSWRGWQILGRMSLSVLLVHWNYNLSLLAVKTNLVRTSFYEIMGHSLTSLFLTYLTSLPLHIFVELPTQKFLQNIFV